MKLLEMLKDRLPVEHLAVHFHDSYGQAAANIFAALQVCPLDYLGWVGLGWIVEPSLLNPLFKKRAGEVKCSEEKGEQK